MPQPSWFDQNAPGGGIWNPNEQWVLDPATGQYVRVPGPIIGPTAPPTPTATGFVPTAPPAAAAAPQYSYFEQQVIDAYRRAGHSPPDAGALNEWANALARNPATMAQLEGTLANAMSQPGAQRYNYGAATGTGGGLSIDELMANLRQYYPGGTLADLKKAQQEHPEWFAGGTFSGSKGDKWERDGVIYDLVIAAGEGGKGWNGGRADGGGSGAMGDFIKPWTETFSYKDFVGPTPEEVLKTPGYQFRLGEGQKALERSAAARGTLNTGGTLKDLADWSQELASTEYGQAYQRALGEWASGRDAALQDYLLRRENFYAGEDRPFGKWMSLAELGQASAANLGSLGANYAGNAASTLTGGANIYADYLTQGANARAAGRVGRANVWGGALGNIGNTGMNLAYLGMLREPRGRPGNISGYVPRGLPPGYGSVYDTWPVSWPVN